MENMHQNIIGIKEALNDKTRMKELVKFSNDDGLNYFYIFISFVI